MPCHSHDHPPPMPATAAQRRRAHRRSAGFTLMEAALTTVIIGTGVLAILAAQQAYHQKNNWAQRTGTAMLLANEIRELTMHLPHHDPITGTMYLGPEPWETGVEDFNDLDDFAGEVDADGFGSGTTFRPPINALRQPIPNMDNWQQHVMVESVRSDDISTTYTHPLGSTDMMRVTVTISYFPPQTGEAEAVTRLSWVVPPQ